MKAPFFLSIAASLLASASPALAWLDQGHMTVAAYAYARLDPLVREQVDALLKLNPSYSRWVDGVSDDRKGFAAFTHAAVWADDIKRDAAYTRDKVTDLTSTQNIGYADHFVHDYWHYIDIPFTTDETPVKMPDSPNALTQLRVFATTLSSSADPQLKSYDLVWMLHIVGDLHQPLHATARFSKELEDDRGGNDEEVISTSGEKAKLHLYWDSLLGMAGTPDSAGNGSRQAWRT